MFEDGTTATPGRASAFLTRNAVMISTVAVLLIASLVAVSTQSVAHLFDYDSFLLAGLGAVSLNLVIGAGGQVSIGNPLLLATGAFTAVACLRAGLPFPGDLFVASAAAGVMGVLVGIPAIRLRGLYLALASLAGLYVVVYFAQLYQSHTVGSTGFSLSILFGSHGVEKMHVYWTWLLVAILCVVVVGAEMLGRGRAGRAWRMIRDHEVVAPTLGVPVTRYKLVLFGVTSAVIGLQGALTAHLVGSVTYETYTLSIGISYVAMIFVGGLDSVVGSLIGACIITWLPLAAPSIVSDVFNSRTASTEGPQIAEIIYGILIIVFVTMSPRGIVGWFAQLRRSLSRRWGSAGPSTEMGRGQSELVASEPAG